MKVKILQDITWADLLGPYTDYHPRIRTDRVVYARGAVCSAKQINCNTLLVRHASWHQSFYVKWEWVKILP